MYDCVIVGMGPAGMSAGIYAKRSGLKTLILEKNSPGGLINITNLVDNYLGFDNISGPDLAFKMFEHVKNNGVEYKIEEVVKIKKENDIFKISTNKNNYESKTVILAGGRQAKKMPLEENLKTLSVSRCSICDAPLYKDKEVVVIGGGNSAFEEGIYLSDFVSKLTILVRSDIKADNELVEQARNKQNIKIIENANIINIEEQDSKYKLTLENSEIISDGLFSYIGYAPETEYLSSFGILESNGYIEVMNTETIVPGLFAAGDIIKKSVYQIITASSEGAEAALKVKKYISNMQ